MRRDIPAVYSRFANRKTSFLIAIAYRKNAYSRRVSGMIWAMSDITEAGPRLKAMNDRLRRIGLSNAAEVAANGADTMRIDVETCRDPDLLAGEVRRLRAVIASEQRLTDAEREAMSAALDFCERTDKPLPTSDQVATLRGLLERHFQTPENQSSQDKKPDTHSNQECAISPPWMARPFWVDPASGWRYGFPKLYDPAKDGDMTAWLIANGYPKYLADQNLPCTFTAKIDSQ